MRVGSSAGQGTTAPPPGPPDPPDPPTTTIRIVQLTMPGIRALCILGALVAPGMLIGAAIAYRSWRRLRPQPSGRWTSAIVLAAIGALFVPVIVWLWPLRLLFGLFPHGGNIVVSVIGEALWGPLVLQAILHVTVYERRLPHHIPGASAIPETPTNPISAPSSSPPSASSSTQPTVSWVHPSDAIRLGTDASSMPFDLSLDELKQHVFIPGVPGTGKTTTLTRLMDGALANGYGVVIIDCKGGSLRTEARRVAGAHKVATYIVSLSDPSSYGYNPCTGSGASVGSKIVGALSYEGNADVYGNVASGIIPPIVNAMRMAGEAVTLDSLYKALTETELNKLAHRAEIAEQEEMIGTLKSIAKPRDGGTLANGRDGLRDRLMAFCNGTFGELLRKNPALSWDEVLAQPSVAYLELPALRAEKDVGLLGRLLLEEFKEVAMGRLEARVAGKDVQPILLIIDEFAALKEMSQINNLLLQGREAAMAIVVATQYLPEEAALRKVVVGADVLLVHRLQVEDAEMIAKQVGTHGTMETSITIDDTRDPQSTTPRQSTNVRLTEKFNVEPQMLANLRKGQIAVRSVARSESGWCGIVKIHKEISGS